MAKMVKGNYCGSFFSAQHESCSQQNHREEQNQVQEKNIPICVTLVLLEMS